MTVKELVYTLWRRLENGFISDDSSYTYRELRTYIISGVALSLKQSYLEQRNLEDFKYGDDSITTTYKTSVLTDADSGLKYVTLQNETISIAGNRFTTVSSTNAVNKLSINYIPIRREELLVRKMQPCIPNVVLYYKQEGKLYFYGDKTTETSVFVSDRYAIPKSDESELTMPEEFGNQVIEGALRLIVPTRFPADRENNGVPNL